MAHEGNVGISGREQSKRFGLPSGAALAVTVAPFQDAWGLTKAALRSVRGAGAGISEEDLGKDFNSLSAAALKVPGLFDRLISFATSPEVEACVFQCAKRALYIPNGSVPAFPGVPVTQELFDDPEHGMDAREDYAMIISKIMEVNCKPFLARILSSFLERPMAAAADEKSAGQK